MGMPLIWRWTEGRRRGWADGRIHVRWSGWKNDKGGLLRLELLPARRGPLWKH